MLQDKKDFTLQTLRDAAYDSYLTAFADLIPVLLKSYDQTPASNLLKSKLAEQVALLRSWDYRWSAASVPTALAVHWGEEMWRSVRADAESEDMTVYDFIAKRTSPERRLQSAGDGKRPACRRLRILEDAVGRHQPVPAADRRYRTAVCRLGASIPVGFASSRWGSLASFGARPYKGSKKIYGTSGNSFVAVVGFGDSVRALAVTAGGLNGVPGSKHFNDQAERYAKGDLREVHFYPNQLKGHTERAYRPGEEK